MNDYRIAVFIIFIAIIVAFNCKTYENFSCDLECIKSEENNTRKHLLMTLKKIKEIISNMFSVNFEDLQGKKVVNIDSFAHKIKFQKVEDLSKLSTTELTSYLTLLNQTYYANISKIQNERQNVLSNIEEIERDLNENLKNNFKGNCNIYSQVETEYCPSIVNEEHTARPFIDTDINIRRFSEKFNNLINNLRNFNTNYIYITMLRKEFGRVASSLGRFSKDINHDSSVMFYQPKDSV